MSAGDVTPGRRRPDHSDVFELEPGDYCFRGRRLWMVLPGDDAPRALDDRWGITVNEDDTVTVAGSILDRPPDGSPGWHGYLERGVWREI